MYSNSILFTSSLCINRKVVFITTGTKVDVLLADPIYTMEFLYREKITMIKTIKRNALLTVILCIYKNLRYMP